MKEELVGVYFLKGVAPYNPNEIASFPPGEAARLFAEGWAVPVDEHGEPVFPDPEPPETDEDEAEGTDPEGTDAGDDGESGGGEGDPGATDPADGKGEPSGLPEDIPGREVLQESGLTTLEMVRAAESLEDLKGIGQATAAKIDAYLKASEAGDG